MGKLLVTRKRYDRDVRELTAKGVLLWDAVQAMGNGFLSPCAVCKNFNAEKCLPHGKKKPAQNPVDCSCFDLDPVLLEAGRDAWWPDPNEKKETVNVDA